MPEGNSLVVIPVVVKIVISLFSYPQIWKAKYRYVWHDQRMDISYKETEKTHFGQQRPNAGKTHFK